MNSFVKTRKPSLLPWIRVAVVLGSVRIYLLKLIPGFIKKWPQRLGQFIDPMEEEEAYENPKIIGVIQSAGEGWGEE